MEQYTGFAQVYDLFMDNVPYDDWTKYLCKLLKELGIKDGLICELGCGTGNITRRLRDKGYDMIGIDNSPDMLRIAMDKEEPEDESILYLLQDMREFELYGTVAAVISICDSMNYILEDEDMLTVFSLVNNYLDPGGYFIFDLNTKHYYSKELGDCTICENREQGSFIWENSYDPESCINEFDMTIYYSEDGSNPYARYEETHYQRAYSLPEIKKLLKKAGLEFVTAYEAMTKEEPGKTTGRMYVVARETGKTEENHWTARTISKNSDNKRTAKE